MTEIIECELPTNPLFKNLTNQVFNRLTVISYAGKQGEKQLWNCRCICDCMIVAQSSNLKLGLVKSCGCYKKEKATSHGMYNTAEYLAWRNMKSRCSNVNDKNYIDYGGRGISYCDRWEKFENFISDMGKRPTEKHSLDRTDNDGNYCAENCEWVTKSHQTKNRRSAERIKSDREKYKNESHP